MSFIISARTATSEVRYRRLSMLEALERSLALVASGMQDVAVTDPSGKRYDPATFGRMLAGGRTEDAVNDGRAIARAA